MIFVNAEQRGVFIAPTLHHIRYASRLESFFSNISARRSCWRSCIFRSLASPLLLHQHANFCDGAVVTLGSYFGKHGRGNHHLQHE